MSLARPTQLIVSPFMCAIGFSMWDSDLPDAVWVRVAPAGPAPLQALWSPVCTTRTQFRSCSTSGASPLCCYVPEYVFRNGVGVWQSGDFPR